MPLPTDTPDDSIPLRPSPLVSKVFGEPRFHTEGDVAALAYAADGTLWSIDETGLLRRWAPDGKLLARHFLSDLETVWCFSPDAKLLASGNDSLILWDVATGHLVKRLPQSAWVTAIGFGPDGRTIASGHDDGVVRFWDTASQRFLGQVQACSKPVPVSAVACSSRGEYVATAGEERVVRLWNELTHKLVGELSSHTDRIPAMAWSPDGRLLVSAGWDTSARVWRPPQTEPVILLNSHADQVHTLAFSPDGKLLACADSNFDIHLWRDPEKAIAGPVLHGHTDEIVCLAFSPDGSKLASAGLDRVIHIWDTREGKLLAGPNPKGRHVIAVVPGRPLRLASSGETKVRVWNTESEAEIAPTGLCPAYCVAASPDGKWLAIGGTDDLTKLWNVLEGRLIASLEATKPPVGFATFSADSKYLAHTSPADGLVWIWKCDTATAELLLIEAADGCTLEGISFHPDGRRIAAGGVDYLSTGTRDGAVSVWDIPTKDKLFTIDVGVYAVEFDPQGKYLAGAGFDDAVYVWDVETQETVFVLGGHQGKIHTVVFSPDGSYIVSGGDDSTIRVWDVLSGRFLVAREFDSAVQSLAFSPDGWHLYCGNGNTTCYQIEFKRLLED
ncbi:MAG: WD40 repeat domain-containing protein [Planctomycetes bacterium]|nr:WD40 repeat domain-containing protein [Planctomycetota bacterium]